MLDCKHGNYYALARKDGKDEYLALTEKEALELGASRIFHKRADARKTACRVQGQSRKAGVLRNGKAFLHQEKLGGNVMIIRPLEEKDIPYVEEIEKEAFGDRAWSASPFF